MSQTSFETFTLGTLAVIVVATVAGYFWALAHDNGAAFTKPIQDRLVAEEEKAMAGAGQPG